MRNAVLEEAQAGIKIARRNVNNIRYADDTPLWQKVKKRVKDGDCSHEIKDTCSLEEKL